MVKRGGGVVFCMAGSAAKSWRKNAPAFSVLFSSSIAPSISQSNGF
jgi:hypothetical protein